MAPNSEMQFFFLSSERPRRLAREPLGTGWSLVGCTNRRSAGEYYYKTLQHSLSPGPEVLWCSCYSILPHQAHLITLHYSLEVGPGRVHHVACSVPVPPPSPRARPAPSALPLHGCPRSSSFSQHYFPLQSHHRNVPRSPLSPFTNPLPVLSLTSPTSGRVVIEENLFVLLLYDRSEREGLKHTTAPLTARPTATVLFMPDLRGTSWPTVTGQLALYSDGQSAANITGKIAVVRLSDLLVSSLLRLLCYPLLFSSPTAAPFTSPVLPSPMSCTRSTASTAPSTCSGLQLRALWDSSALTSFVRNSYNLLILMKMNRVRMIMG